jgi:hypothetical protein
MLVLGIIHPAVWVQVLKMARRYFKNDIFDILDYYRIKYEKKEYYFEYDKNHILENLSELEQITVIREILELPDFWFDDRDNSLLRNSEINRYNYSLRQFKRPSYLITSDNIDPEPELYVASEEKYWGEKLLKILEDRNGIIYDKGTKSFSMKERGSLHILSKIENPNILVEIKFRDHFLNKIVEDLNGTYRAGFYTPTLFLIRKLIENSIICILEDKFPRNQNNNINLYFDVHKNRYKDFSDLLLALNSKRSSFVIKNAVTRFMTLATNLKDKTNSFIHHLEYNGSKEDVEGTNVVDVIELLRKIDERDMLEIRNIPKNI